MCLVCIVQSFMVCGRIKDGVRAADYGLKAAVAIRDRAGEAHLRKAKGLLLVRLKAFDQAKAQLGACSAEFLIRASMMTLGAVFCTFFAYTSRASPCVVPSSWAEAWSSRYLECAGATACL